MSISSISGRRGRGRSVTAEAVLVDSFQKGSALRRAKVSAIVVALVATAFIFVIANAVASTSTAALVAVVAGLGLAVATFVVSWAWPVLRVLWHWAGELVLTGVLGAVYTVLAVSFGGLIAGVMLVVVTGVPFAFGPSRRFVIRWGACMVMRHRLRVACDAFVEGKGVHGAVKPLILLARPTPAGERIWVWLRGSLTLDDVIGRVKPIASTCWAKRATAEAAGSKAAYVRIDLFRRDPLAETIESPLVELVKEFLGKTDHEPEGDEPEALNLDEITDSDVDAVMVNMKNPGKKPTKPAKPGKSNPAVTDSTGEDITDWV